MKQFKKLFALFLITLLLGVNVISPSISFAEEVQTESTQEQTTQEQPKEEPKTPEAPTAPQSPKAPDGPGEAPSAPEAPTAPQSPKSSPPEAPTAPSAPKNREPKSTSGSTSGSTQNTTPKENTSGGTSSNGNVGDTAIDTGNANSNGSILNNGNTNLATNGCTVNCGFGSTTVKNTGNGTGSTSNGSATTTNNSNTNQNNSANLNNEMNQSAVTGKNDTSYNVGNSSINTGDANVTGTIINSVNTNVDGVMVSEFNIVDDHIGDIILDFGAACIQGCNGQSITAENSGNGAYSDNFANAENTTNDTTNQTNDAIINNGMVLVADSGNNDAKLNTGGDSNITTGDANVSANVMNFANNNFAGNVIYGAVNIFGNLVGDIILTQEMMNTLCGGTCEGSTTAVNSGNGEGSTNIANASNTYNENIFQNNEADITNTILVDTNTGGNDTNFNTGGNNSIATGDASTDINVLNIANMNLVGGNYWLVLVNQAGNWVGQIMGGPAGSNVAGSPLMEFLIDPVTGAITAMTSGNEGNGAGSNNSTNVSNETNKTINQTNTAAINNTLDLSANTGNNTASYNTGGDSNITTGDANIVANIVNFVNNNIVGDGTLVVTVINVFGSWVGDFVSPGQEKQSKNLAIGGANPENNTQTNSETSTTDENKESKTAATTQNQEQNNQSNNDGENVKTTISSISHAADLTVAAAKAKTPQLVKGISTVKESAEKAVSINLAWILLALPFISIILLRRKLRTVIKLLPR